VRAIGEPRPRKRLIGLTPLVDVVFILLVFFMLASSFLDWRAMELTLPARATLPAANSRAVEIVLAADGSVSVEGRAISAGELGTRVAPIVAADPARPFVVRSAAGVALQRAVAVLDVLAAAGARSAMLAPHAGGR
jgi:biopolymer transport protein ExbD